MHIGFSCSGAPKNAKDEVLLSLDSSTCDDDDISDSGKQLTYETGNHSNKKTEG
jgi:hypothetical protein